MKVGGRVPVTNSEGFVIVELPEGSYVAEAGVMIGTCSSRAGRRGGKGPRTAETGST